MPTIKDVAQLAGTSASTVSIIVNGRATERHISPETQRRVRDAIAQLGYVPNRTAQQLRAAQRNPTVALFWTTDYRSSMLARFLYGMEQAMGQRAPQCEILVQPYKTGELAQQQTLAGMPPFDGIIVGNANEDDLAFLASHDLLVPTMLYNRRIGELGWVAVDDTAVGVLAADALGNARHVLVLAAPPVFPGMATREEACAAALRQRGATVSSLPLSSMSSQAGYDALMHILTAARRGEAPLPTAIFAPSDTVAFGAMRACHEQGLSIPHDVSIVAVGNGIPEYAAFSTPPLTTVEIPIEDMAAACLEALAPAIAGAADGSTLATHHQLIDPHLIRRASTEPQR